MTFRPPTLVVLLSLGACASPAPARTAQPATSRGGGWASASWEDRHDTMTFAVLPNMARLFQRFYGSTYPTMTCRTCHGADAEAVHYAMPHGLPPLDPQHLPDGRDPDARRARLARFMKDEVTPQMADLIDMPLGDPQSRQGFSCFRCHPSKATP